MPGRAILAVTITWCRNTAGQLTVVTVITAARAPTMAITSITVVPAIMAVDRVTTTTVPTRAGRIPIGVTEPYGGYYPYSYWGSDPCPWPLQSSRGGSPFSAAKRSVPSIARQGWDRPCYSYEF